MRIPNYRGGILTKPAIAYLTEILEKELTHRDIETIILFKLELPQEYVEGRNKKSKLMNLLIKISNEPQNLIRFLQIILNEYIKEDFGKSKEKKIEKIKKLLDSCGIRITYDDNNKSWIAKIATPIKEIKIRQKSWLEDVLPGEVQNRLEEAKSEFSNGKFDVVTGKCRTALEAFAKKQGFGKYKDFIRDMYNRGILREKERDIMIKLYDYLSSFELPHASPKPSKEQALYALYLTDDTLEFIVKLLEKRK